MHAIALDITDRSAIAALPHRLPAELNGVVNNAGIIVNGPVEGLSLDDLTQQLDVNVISQIAVTQPVLPKVGVVQRAGDSVNDRDSEFSGHACRVPPLYQLGRVDAVDVVHRDPYLAVVVASVMDSDDMGMLEASCEVSLTNEPLAK